MAELSRSEIEQLREWAEFMFNDDEAEMEIPEYHEEVFREWEREVISQEPPNNYLVVQTETTTPPDNNTHHSDDHLLRLLTNELREVIKAEVKDVKEKEEYQVGLNPDPITYFIPINYNDDIPLRFNVKWRNIRLSFEHHAYPPAPEEKKEKTRPKAMLAARKITSFKLSEDCMIHAMNFEREKLQASRAGNEPVNLYSFNERLDGWCIDRKMRPNSSAFDMYFEHEKSKGKFRSVNEVINFILHEANPKMKPTDGKKGESEESLPLVPPGYEEPGRYPCPNLSTSMHTDDEA